MSISLNFEPVDISWQPCLQQALKQVEPAYLNTLSQKSGWLPGGKNIFNAFSLPLTKVEYILFGESPYPRAESANGYAFWDNAVKEIWSNNGLSKSVNRATSLRNFIKMLLVAENELTANDLSQAAIAKVNKHRYVQKLNELFSNMQKKGFLLLNASLVLSDTSVNKEARYWLPFMQTILAYLSKQRPAVKLLLFGNIAKIISKMSVSQPFDCLISEHPYNVSFITNRDIVELFNPLHLLIKEKDCSN